MTGKFAKQQNQDNVTRVDCIKSNMWSVTIKFPIENCKLIVIKAYCIFIDNCDLNLRIGEDGLKAHPLTVEGFAMMWAGARSTYGVDKGKVAFEVKVSTSCHFSCHVLMTFYYS